MILLGGVNMSMDIGGYAVQFAFSDCNDADPKKRAVSRAMPMTLELGNSRIHGLYYGVISFMSSFMSSQTSRFLSGFRRRYEG
jgi:hypothetical protein